MPRQTRLERLRDAATNPTHWSCSRFFFLTPRPSPWHEADATAAALALFAKVAPGAVLSRLHTRGASCWSTGTYGRPDADVAWAADGGGVLVAVNVFGASPSDGLDRLFHCVWPARGLVVFDEALDYTQTGIHLELAAIGEEELDGLERAAREILRARGAVHASAVAGRQWPRKRR